MSVAVGLYYELGQKKHNGWPVAVSNQYLQPFILTSFAVSLLLVFRTNASYDRWWEVRKSFGQMYNCIRSLGRMAVAYIAPQQPAIAAEILRWDAVLCAASCAFLRDDLTYLDPYSDLLSVEQMSWLRSTAQPPIAATMAISALIMRSCATDYQRVSMMGELTSFDIYLGACERVRQQTIPLAYTRHTSRFMIVYISFLPFGLWAFCSWLTIPIMAVLCFLLVGIENIGVQIEQPLIVLPLDKLAAGCRTAVEAITKAQHGAELWAEHAEHVAPGAR